MSKKSEDYKEVVTVLIKYIKQQRQEKLVKSKDIDKMLGKSQGYYSKIENQAYIPDNETLKKIVDYLNIDLLLCFPEVITDIDGLFRLCSALDVKPSEVIKDRVVLEENKSVDEKIADFLTKYGNELIQRILCVRK